jgi:hypothetical protein
MTAPAQNPKGTSLIFPLVVANSGSDPGDIAGPPSSDVAAQESGRRRSALHRVACREIAGWGRGTQVVASDDRDVLRLAILGDDPIQTQRIGNDGTIAEPEGHITDNLRGCRQRIRRACANTALCSDVIETAAKRGMTAKSTATASRPRRPISSAALRSCDFSSNSVHAMAWPTGPLAVRFNPPQDLKGSHARVSDEQSRQR